MGLGPNSPLRPCSKRPFGPLVHDEMWTGAGAATVAGVGLGLVLRLGLGLGRPGFHMTCFQINGRRYFPEAVMPPACIYVRQASACIYVR